MKFHSNLSSGSLNVPCGHTGRQTDGRTDLEKLFEILRQRLKMNTLFNLFSVTYTQKKTTRLIIVSDFCPRKEQQRISEEIKR
jgi:hypothetical protein